MDAVIDIGSNSVRLAFMQNEVNQKFVNTTLLAKNMQGGILDAESINRTSRGVIDFYNQAKGANAQTVYVFATEAVRSAKNSNILLDAIKNGTGIDVDVISGDMESLVGFIGASIVNNEACIIDIGGASVELAQGKNGIRENGLSLPIGVMRVMEKVGNDREALHEFYKKEAQKYQGFNSSLIGIGGTATTLCSMHLNLYPYDFAKVHSTKLTISDLEKLEDIIYSLYTPEKINEAYPVVGLKRAMVIGVGCIALIEIMKRLNKTSITVSEADNIEGYYLLKRKCQL